MKTKDKKKIAKALLSAARALSAGPGAGVTIEIDDSAPARRKGLATIKIKNGDVVGCTFKGGEFRVGEGEFKSAYESARVRHMGVATFTNGGQELDYDYYENLKYAIENNLGYLDPSDTGTIVMEVTDVDIDLDAVYSAGYTRSSLENMWLGEYTSHRGYGPVKYIAFGKVKKVTGFDDIDEEDRENEIDFDDLKDMDLDEIQIDIFMQFSKEALAAYANLG